MDRLVTNLDKVIRIKFVYHRCLFKAMGEL